MHTALVTGASRGLGRALVLSLIQRGVSVVGLARASAALDDLAATAGPRFTPLAADVADPEATARAATHAFAALGHVDLLVHNASTLGPTPLRPTVELTAPELGRVFDVHLTGPHALTQRVVGSMALRGAGTVVAISSDAAVEAYPHWGAYGAAKVAQDHLFRVLAAENPSLRFLSIDPGEMDTDLHAAALPEADRSTLRRPEHVADALLNRLPRLASGTRTVLEVPS